MRLPDMFRRAESDERLAAEVERDLQAVDGALAGLDMHPDFDELARLAVAIRDERPSVDEEFAALLDERAAAGFPRTEATSRAPAAITRAGERLASVRPLRVLSFAGAAASLLVVAGVGVSVLRNSNGGGSSSSAVQTTAAPAASGDVQATPPAKTSSGAAAGGAGASPAVEQSLRMLKPSVATPQAPQARNGTYARAFGAVDARRSSTSAPALSALASRQVSQTANLTLSTDPDKVRTIAASVTQIVSRYRGLVISSSITSGKGSSPPSGGPVIPGPLPFSGGALGADFQLRIPASQLDNALNDLSALGLVVSREQGTQDITGRFASVHDRIQSLTSERDQLIKQLANALSQEAVDAINARLHTVRVAIDRAHGDLGHLRQRVAMVPVHVSVVAKGSGSSGSGGFDLGDAAHDAGRVLTVGAGVLLISLAVIVPLGLIAAVIWLATATTRRRRRERALD